MFLSVFASIISFFSIFNTSNASYHDYKNLVTLSIDNSTHEITEVSHIPATNNLCPTVYFTSNNVGVMTPSHGTQGIMRYYISSDPSNQSDMAYFQFAFGYDDEADDPSNAYIWPTIETRGNDTFNLKVNLLFNVYSTNGHVAVFTYNRVYDFTKQEDLVSTYYNHDLHTSLFTMQSIANGTNYFDLALTFYPISQDELNSSSSYYQSGYDSGYDAGYDDGYRYGESVGFTEGYNYVQDQGATASVIFTGILTIAMLPINFFLAILNFEVFGINIGGAVAGLLTIAIAFIIIRIIFSGGNGKKE